MWLFPIGTVRGTLFSYGLAAIYGGLTSFSTIIQILKRRQTFFYVKNRPQPPNCLTDKNLGEHGFVQLKVSILNFMVYMQFSFNLSFD